MGLSAGGLGAHVLYPEGRAALILPSTLLQVLQPQMSFTFSVKSQILIKQLPLMSSKQIRMKNLPVLFFHSELLDWSLLFDVDFLTRPVFFSLLFTCFGHSFFIISCSHLPSRALFFLFIFSNTSTTIPRCRWTRLHSSITSPPFSVHVPFHVFFLLFYFCYLYFSFIFNFISSKCLYFEYFMYLFH